MSSRPPHADLPPTDSPDLFCPRCGYDLRGIPARRCPECGFGYDRAGLRQLAYERTGELRDILRRVLRVSILALALLTAPLLRCAGLRLASSALPAFAAVLGALIFWRVHEDCGWANWFRPAPITYLLILGAWFTSQLLVMFPGLGVFLAALLLVWAWFHLPVLPWRLPYATRSAPVEEQAAYKREQGQAVLAVGSASLLTLVCWLAW
ncbi:MAG TPA: hypothetical protein PKK06_13690 [Phycisphaerae bacterium]|nr:hypothetical protein [Phycisphaerae bacterium]HNU46138.1 hypothetical protein [Phycisphaerae bacterium]